MNEDIRPLPPLGAQELVSYSRHISMPDIGVAGQQRLKAASVLIVGVGGLGCPAALYLAAAGVGRLGLVDDDRVDASNLQRQVLFTAADVGRPKVEIARERLSALNPHITIEARETRVMPDNAAALVAAYDIVLDGTDNFPSRFLINDACALGERPLVYGSIFRFEGQLSVFDARRGPCYRCLFPRPPAAGVAPNCAEAGVFGILPGIVGAMQAAEALKLALGLGEPMIGRMAYFDALTMRLRELRLARNPDCPLCGKTPSIYTLRLERESCPTRHAGAAHGGKAGMSDDEANGMPRDGEITPRRLNALLAEGSDPMLLDVREPYELEICRLPEAVAIPMRELPARLDELDRARPIVVVCRSGHRSAHVQEFLLKSGFDSVVNLAGGMLAWSDEVDPSVRKY